MSLGNRMLTVAFVRTVTRPGRYGDGRGGRGLILLVRKLANGRTSRVWVQRVRIDGKPTHLELGRWPEVSLSEARAAAMANAREIAQGRDPRRAGVPTFADAVERVIALNEPTWRDGAKSAAQWRASLRDYAIPALGRRRVSEYERVCDERDELIERLAIMNDPDREKRIAGLLEQLRVARLQIREWQTKYETVRRLRERRRAG